MRRRAGWQWERRKACRQAGCSRKPPFLSPYIDARGTTGCVCTSRLCKQAPSAKRSLARPGRPTPFPHRPFCLSRPYGYRIVIIVSPSPEKLSAAHAHSYLFRASWRASPEFIEPLVQTLPHPFYGAGGPFALSCCSSIAPALGGGGAATGGPADAAMGAAEGAATGCSGFGAWMGG